MAHGLTVIKLMACSNLAYDPTVIEFDAHGWGGSQLDHGS